ncbi:MAG: imidazole glycerol phosphate synthase subunit HisH [Pseudomonadota bacterium]
MSVAVIDYGSGNLRSAAKALEAASRAADLGLAVEVTVEARKVRAASRIVLPGVGAFADCKAGLARLPGMLEALQETVIEKGRPFLGICVGMQLMAERGFEHGAHAGLGWIAGEVTPIVPKDPSLKVPHMGWNELELEAEEHPLFAGIASGAHAYFVHGFALRLARAEDRLASVDYGGRLTAAVGRANLAGTQFHPEKSQGVGLRLLANFLRWRP